MSILVSAVMNLLLANAVIAFGFALYWQARVILTFWKDLSEPMGSYNNLGRFISGEVFPELRRKWARAVGYCVLSVVALFIVLGFLNFFAPDYIP